MPNVLLLLIYFVVIVRVYRDRQEDDLPIANKLVISTSYCTIDLFLIYFDVDETVCTVSKRVI